MSLGISRLVATRPTYNIHIQPLPLLRCINLVYIIYNIYIYIYICNSKFPQDALDAPRAPELNSARPGSKTPHLPTFATSGPLARGARIGHWSRLDITGALERSELTARAHFTSLERSKLAARDRFGFAGAPIITAPADVSELELGRSKSTIQARLVSVGR